MVTTSNMGQSYGKEVLSPDGAVPVTASGHGCRPSDTSSCPERPQCHPEHLAHNVSRKVSPRECSDPGSHHCGEKTDFR